MGPTTTTKDWGADEGGEWSNTDTNVCCCVVYFYCCVVYFYCCVVLIRLIGNEVV